MDLQVEHQNFGGFHQGHRMTADSPRTEQDKDLSVTDDAASTTEQRGTTRKAPEAGARVISGMQPSGESLHLGNYVGHWSIG